MLWENLREEEFKEAIEKSKGVCIIPIGCLEKLGQHSPVGVDIIHSQEVARLAADEEYAVVFPTMYFGEKSGSGEFAGTVMFSAPLRFQILQETCREIARNGFKKIVFYNGHGGNHNMIGNFTRSLLYDKVDYQAFQTNLTTNIVPQILEEHKEGKYPYLTDEDVKVLQSFVDKDVLHGHACFVETGLVYGIRPETIRLDKMDQESGMPTGRFDKFAELGIGTHFAWMANYPNSYAGAYHPGLTETIGKAMVEVSKDNLKKQIKFLKEETISTEYMAEWMAKQN